MKNKAIGLMILGLGVVCVAIGAANGQYADVFRKAIFICMECIGIG